MTTMPRQLEYTPVSANGLLNVFAQGIDDLAAAVYGSTTRTHVPSCLLKLNAYKNCLTGTNVISWDAPIWDTDTMWSGSNPTLITINTPGQWLVVQQLVFTAGASGHMWGFVTQNSTNVATGSVMFSGGSAVFQSVIGTVPVQCALGDVLRCYTDQSSGGTLQLQNDFGATKFGAIWLGP